MQLADRVDLRIWEGTFVEGFLSIRDLKRVDWIVKHSIDIVIGCLEALGRYFREKWSYFRFKQRSGWKRWKDPWFRGIDL